MIRAAAILALIACASAATLTKKDGYGGSGYTQQSAFPSSGGANYDASAAYSSADTSYGGAAAPAPSYGSGTSDSAASSGSGDSYGNLYYYYYPVTNHSSAPAPSSHGAGGGSYGQPSGGGSYGGNAGGSYGGSSGGQSYGGNSGGSYGGSSGGSYGGSGGGSYGSGGGSYGGGGYQAGGGAVGGYYPPGGSSFSDPFGGLLSIIGTIDINSLILPALLIGGVALLLPAILNCDLELGTCVIPLPTINGAGRKRRGLDMQSEMQMTIPQMIEHAYRIYDAVHEGEECMQRVVCEVGGMMSNIRGKEAFFSVLEHLSSPSYKNQLSVLKKGALGRSADQESTCDAYECGKLGLKPDHPMDNKVD